MTEPEAAPAEAESAADYLGKRHIADKGYRPGVPEEARELAERSDIVLTLATFGVSLVAIIDRQASRRKRFEFSRAELVEIGRACLKYSGTYNGAKMPVIIRLIEVGGKPPSDEDLVRLRALAKAMPGLAKVAIHCFYLDAESGAVWSPSLFNGLFRGRGWFEKILREPRKDVSPAATAPAALPKRESPPIATISLLAFLLVMFVVEQSARVTDKPAPGILGVDVGTLYALGGMNHDALTKHGEYYRLLTAALLHADGLHLLMNGLALGLAGFFLESLLGSAWFLSLFFVGALGGSVAGLLFNDAMLVSVGASGAVMCLLAAGMVAAMRYPVGPQRTQIQVNLARFLIPSLLPLATVHNEGKIDFAAHFGGAIMGALCGFLLLRVWPKEQAHPRHGSVIKAVAIAGVACFAVGLALVKSHYDATAADVAFDPAAVLVPDEEIPKDVKQAEREVESWGHGKPRDPRVHLFRSLDLMNKGQFAQAESDIRAALAEREILDRAFTNGHLEATLRSVLAESLQKQGRIDEAKREAKSPCATETGDQPLHRLGLCD